MTIDEEKVKKIIQKKIGNYKKIELKKLSGGLKNIIYLIEVDNKKYVFKSEPDNKNFLLSIDTNLLKWEASITTVLRKIGVLVPKIIDFDDNQFSYILMEYLNGDNYDLLKKENSNIDFDNIETELGKYNRLITNIKRDYYFLPSNPYLNFESNYEFIKYLFSSVINDGISAGISYDFNLILELIDNNKEALNDVINISLVPTDLWDGNILVKDNKISGLIDFGDVYFGDELLSFYFHKPYIYDQNISSFLKGYNKTDFTKNELIRIEIYRIFNTIKMIVDCKKKKYGEFPILYEHINKSFDVINNLKSKVKVK